jgi:hypothetical protein
MSELDAATAARFAGVVGGAVLGGVEEEAILLQPKRANDRRPARVRSRY